VGDWAEWLGFSAGRGSEGGGGARWIFGGSGIGGGRWCSVDFRRVGDRREVVLGGFSAGRGSEGGGARWIFGGSGIGGRWFSAFVQVDLPGFQPSEQEVWG
jgi:hypothetical protein